MEHQTERTPADGKGQPDRGTPRKDRHFGRKTFKTGRLRSIRQGDGTGRPSSDLY